MPFKFLRFPSSTTDQSKNSRLSFNIFYFTNRDTQKDSGLEIKFMLDTGASCSILKYGPFWEIWQTQHPFAVNRSTKETNTYSGQIVPMIGSETITFSYDPDGQFSFLLTLWITEIKSQKLLNMTSVKNKYLAFASIYPDLNLKSH